jgi:hypothetical protein
MFRKNAMKILDGFNTGLLTLNKIMFAGNEFGGVVGNIKLDDIKIKIDRDKAAAEKKSRENFKQVKHNLKQQIPSIKVQQIKDENKITPSEPQSHFTKNISDKINSTHKIENLLRNDFQKSEEKLPNSKNNPISESVGKLENEIVIGLKDEKVKDNQIIDNLDKESQDDLIDDKLLLKSDKVKFNPKQSRIPVSSFSRALNVGMLGASMIGNTMTQVLKDKVN